MKIASSCRNIRVFKLALNTLWASSRIHLVIVLVLSCCVALPDVINLVVWKHIIDEISSLLISPNIGWHRILLLFLLHFLLVIARLMISKLNNYFKEIYVVYIDRYLTNETINIIKTLDLVDIEDAQLHNDIKKTNEESTARSMGILNNVVEIIMNLTTVIGTIGLLASYRISIILLIVVSIIPNIVINQKSMKKLFDVYESRFEKIRFYNYLKEMIVKYENFKEIKLFSSIGYIKDKINQIFNSIIEQDVGVKKNLLIMSTIGGVIEYTVTYVFKVIIVINGITQRLTLGTIIMSIESATKLQNSITNLVSLILTLYDNCLYLISFNRLTEKKLLKKSELPDGLIKDFKIHTVELKNVGFTYKNSNKHALTDINISLSVGNNYAIVGRNGSGKTTLIKIILGLYAPSTGDVLVNGISLNKYDKSEYFNKISSVFQDFVKYPLTVKENIGIAANGDENNILRIKMAAELGQSHSFIERLNEGYDAKLLVGWEGSEDISTGQWQRIAISRGLIRNASIMVFDESTSSLDAKTEYDILKTLLNNNDKRNAINIIITHRFINIRDVGTIFVINDGAIFGMGNHDHLMQNNTLYAEMYKIQINANKE